MNKLIILCLTLTGLQAFAQGNVADRTKPIIEAGKRLYKSEMASWYGTDLFLEKYKAQANISGYFSYTEKDVTKCIFYSKAIPPKVIGTMSFDSTYNTETAQTDLRERDFTALENDLYAIRNIAADIVKSDTLLFKSYSNTNFNLIPIISKDEKKVYVLTGPKNEGVIIFGNDYLLTFDQHNKLIDKKQLHKNIILLKTGDPTTGKQDETMHSHAPETGDFITATDICTLLLYEKFTTWKQHSVASKNYLNIWNCLTNELVVLPMATVERMNKDQKKSKKKKKE